MLGAAPGLQVATASRLLALLPPRDRLTEALRRACRWGNTEAARELLAAGADPHAPSRHDGRLVTPVHCAAASGSESLLRLLLQQKPRGPLGLRQDADLELAAAQSLGLDGWLCLMPRHSHPDSESESTEDGPAAVLAPSPIGPDGKPSLDVRDVLGRSPLHYAAAADASPAVRYLLLHGADPSATDCFGRSAVQCAESGPETLGDDPELMIGGAARAEGGTSLSPAWVSSFRRPGTGTGNSGATKSGEQSTQAALVLAFERGDDSLSAEPVPGSERRRASKEALAVLRDEGVLFWNASVRANRLYNLKLYGAAMGAYGDALRLAPSAPQPATHRDMATLHYNRARAAYRLGQHVSAVEDCGAALKQDGTYRNALAQRAECHMALFGFSEAADDFESLLETDPTDRQWARRLLDARHLRDLSHY